MRLKRVYNQFLKWEEIQHNMWGSVDDRKAWTQKAIKFTGDHQLYGSYMKRVIYEWPISCENALTDYSLNRKAWLGHAAAALAIGCPEDITRQAWGYLTDEQRFLANRQAERYISEWEFNYSKSQTLHQNMGESLLL